MHGLRGELAEREALEAARYAVYRASYEVKLLLAEIAHKRFNPNQPRVPAGNSDGGQWTATGGSGGARIHRVSRTPPRPPGGGRFTVAPRVMPVRIAGRTEMVSLTTYNQLQSSAALARNMTNLARRFDGNWRPEPSMVGNVAGQIAANQSTAAQAVRFIHQTNPNALPQASTMSIVAPRGNPVGFVAPRAASTVRTLRTEQEMQMMIARLLTGARPLSKPHFNGMAYIRPDGVIVTIRESRRNGVTIDLTLPNARHPSVEKIHVLQPLQKGLNLMTSSKSEPYDFPIVRRVNNFAFDAQVPFEEGTFLDYCREFVGDGAPDNTLDFRQRQIDMAYNFHDNDQLEKAMRYFMSYVMSRGYAPMNFIDVLDPELDYGPITKYGVRPQEIIDNIIADWRSRGCKSFEPFEVMLGWERDCGLFMEDDEEEPGH